MTNKFDGHANCFIETGHGKGLLIDFNYETEPLPGKYPLPGVGPFSLLKETEMNHWGKVMFRWIYWNILLPGEVAGARPDVDGREDAGGRVMSTATTVPVDQAVDLAHRLDRIEAQLWCGCPTSWRPRPST